MSFARIQDFLPRYQRYFSDKEEEREKICGVIAKISGIHISPHEFTVARGELSITGNTVLKNELFLFKEQIIEELHKNGLTGINGIR